VVVWPQSPVSTELALHHLDQHRSTCGGGDLVRYFCDCDEPTSVFECAACGEPLLFDAGGWCEHATVYAEELALLVPAWRSA
jgi:hypothetical protein